MSGYDSVEVVRRVTRETLQMEGRDSRDYNVTGILRDAFQSRGPGYGYGARDEQAWRAAVTRHHQRKP